MDFRATIFRPATIKEIDYKTYKVRVSYDEGEKLSPFLPYIMPHGTGINQEVWWPDLEDTVMVFTPFRNNLAEGWVFGHPWQAELNEILAKENVYGWFWQFKEDAEDSNSETIMDYIRYDRNTNRLEVFITDDVEAEIGQNLEVLIKGDADITVEGNATALIEGNADVTVEGNLEATVEGTTEITSEGHATINANSNATINGNVQINGNVSVAGNISAAAGSSGGGAITASGEVTSRRGVKLSTHTHPHIHGHPGAGAGGGNTSPPN